MKIPPLARRHVLTALIGLLLLSGFTTRLFSQPQRRPLARRLANPVAVRAMDGRGLRFTLHTTPPATGKDGRWQVTGLDGRLQEPGAPDLPIYTTLIALPPEATAAVQVQEGLVTAAVAVVEPVPGLAGAPAADDQGYFARLDEALLQAVPDPAVYQNDAAYPAGPYALSDPHYLRDTRLVWLTLYPVRYNPARGRLYHAAEIEVTVTFHGGQANNGRSLPAAGDSFERILADQVLNYRVAREWRALPQGLEAPTTELPLGVDVYKIEVNQDAIYEVDYATLAAAGMDVNTVNPHTFQMLYRGQPVAYQFLGDGDNQFESGEKLRFYGRAFYGPRLEKQFVVNNVYWLWAGGAPSLMTSGSNPAGFPADASFLSSATREPEVWWYATWTDQWDQFPNEPDAWYWDRLLKPMGSPPITTTYSVTLPYPAVAGPDAVFTAEFSSRPGPSVDGIEQPHVVTVSMNSQPNPGTLSWYGKQNVNISSTVPHAVVIDGANSFAVVHSTNTSGGQDFVFLNRITVDYQRRYVAAGDRLIFADEQGGQRRFDVGGFTVGNAADVQVWDVSDPLNPVQVPMLAGNIGGTSPYTYTFGSDHPAGAQFIAANSASVLAPLVVSQYIAPDLDPADGADWLAVTYRDFITETQRMAAHRAQPQFGGLQTHVVDVEHIINQYGYGLPLPAAVHDYFQHALLTWATPPSYAVMVGDATVNPKYIDDANIGNEDPQLVLTDLVFKDRFQGQVPSDLPFTLLVGDDLLPEIHIGRVPAQTLEQLTAVVDKLILYEQNHLAPQPWMGNILFVSDDPEAGDDFCLENAATGGHIPASFYQEHLCLPPGATGNDAQILRSQLFSYTNSIGLTMLNYRGHGALQNWAASPVIMANSDVANWDNPQRPVVIVTGDCLDGWFVYPGMPGLGETFLKAPGKGSVAHWSSTGLGFTSEHSVLTSRFYDGLFVAGQTAIGDAVTYAKVAYFNYGAHSSLLYTFLLQGDPAMRLFRPELSLSQSASTGHAAPGDQLDFVLTVTNNGLYPSRVTLTDDLPADLSFVSASASVTSTIAVTGSLVVANLYFSDDPTNQGLPPGVTAVVTLTVQVAANAPPGPRTNTAVISGTGFDSLPGNNSAQATVIVVSGPTPTATPLPNPTERLYLPLIVGQ